MKKVGIVTMNDNDNYGNRLQNYATHYVLKNLGTKPITIKNTNRLNKKNTFSKYTYKKISFYLHYIKDTIFNINNKRLKKFKEFNKNIEFTRNIKTIYNVQKTNFDYYVVGSDQVWKPTYSRLSDMDLLTFADDKKKISFSASFGISVLPEEYKEKTKRELLKFKAISVREEAGKKIAEELTNRKDIEVLVDPTMLLSSEEWDKVSKRPEQLDDIKEKNYILNYFLGELSEERKKEIERVAKENDCYVINILDKKNPFYETGPSEFLYLEKNAFLICTDSFHSSVFAILYDRPFIVFDREDNRVNMSSRIDTLLSKFQLENRKYKGKITKELLNNDYTKAYKELEKEKIKSFKFLKKALEIESESEKNDK